MLWCIRSQKTYSSCITEILYTLINICQFSLTLQSWKPLFYSLRLHFNSLDCMRNRAVVSICARLVLLSIVYSRLIHVVPSDRNSFFTGDCIIMWQHATFSLSTIHWQTQAVTWLWWIVLEGTWESSYIFIILISNTLSIYPEVGLLDYILDLFLVLQRTFIQFSMSIPTSIPTNSVHGFLLPYIATNSCYLSSFDNKHSAGGKWYLCGCSSHISDD
jgi:hypothetical protein